MTVVLDLRADFSLEAMQRVAWGGDGVKLGSTARAKIASARADFQKLIER